MALKIIRPKRRLGDIIAEYCRQSDPRFRCFTPDPRDEIDWPNILDVDCQLITAPGGRRVASKGALYDVQVCISHEGWELLNVNVRTSVRPDNITPEKVQVSSFWDNVMLLEYDSEGCRKWIQEYLKVLCWYESTTKFGFGARKCRSWDQRENYAGIRKELRNDTKRLLAWIMCMSDQRHLPKELSRIITNVFHDLMYSCSIKTDGKLYKCTKYPSKPAPANSISLSNERILEIRRKMQLDHSSYTSPSRQSSRDPS
jgi:hypothetical protein